METLIFWPQSAPDDVDVTPFFVDPLKEFTRPTPSTERRTHSPELISPEKTAAAPRSELDANGPEPITFLVVPPITVTIVPVYVGQEAGGVSPPEDAGVVQHRVPPEQVFTDVDVPLQFATS